MYKGKNIRQLLLGLSTSLLVACAGAPKTAVENTAPDLSRGLVAHWTMDNDQINGSTLKDSAGTYDGLLVGGVSQIDGKIGGALKLDGKSGYVTFGNILNEVFTDAPTTPGVGNLQKTVDQAVENWKKTLHLDGKGRPEGNKFSISLWVKPSKLNKNTSILVKLGNSACNPQKNERQFALGIGDGYKANNLVNLSTVTLWNKGFVRVNTPKQPPVNEWTHIVFNYDESVVTDPALRFGLFLNGEKQPLYTVVSGGASDYKIQPGKAPLAMGIVVSSSGPCTRYDYYAGGVDDLRIYDRLLSETEAKQLAHGADKLASVSTTAAVSGSDSTTVAANKIASRQQSVGSGITTASVSPAGISGSAALSTQAPAMNVRSTQTPQHQQAAVKPVAAVPKLPGCWNWSNGAYIVIDADGTARNGPFAATWKVNDVAGGRYTITWPSFVDTLTMSADGSILSGANNYAIPVSATRKSGEAPGVEGDWLWSSGVTVAIRSDSSVSGGGFSGTWHKAADKWVFEWPLVDTVSLAADGRSLSTKNQFGLATAKRDASCKGK